MLPSFLNMILSFWNMSPAFENMSPVFMFLQNQISELRSSESSHIIHLLRRCHSYGAFNRLRTTDHRLQTFNSLNTNQLAKLFTIHYSLFTTKPKVLSALARRPDTPQVEQLSGARDGQSDEGAPARPMHHLL